MTDTDHKRRFRIFAISPQGNAIDEWHVFPVIEGRESGPEGIAIDPNGNIFVSDGGRLQILKVSPVGKLLMSIGGVQTFHNLGHVATGSSGYLYVAKGGQNRIQKFSRNGKRIAIWQRPKGSGKEEWNMPETFAVSPQGNLVMEDWGNQRIIVLSGSGRTQFIFGGAGSGEGQFQKSSGLCLDRDGDIYVADQKLHRVQKFTPSGNLISVISNSANNVLFSAGPTGIAVDREGNLYAPDGLSIVKFSVEGKLLARWN